ncbi:hypothetical protein ATO12_03675 [Aquimarina atlantica]|uniref:Glutamine cyclotransferase n=1 Tax=Aquimarina atlantica TaxID=1317122 RepID=A0A023C0Q9_9FLAO|nr:hypothetical protein [Aquimarina atlantica]EZH75902.1 hypothetical protein ATO12_03675 [Aquimarina atlantica]
MKYILLTVFIGLSIFYSNRIDGLKVNEIPKKEDARKFKFNYRTEYEVFEDNGIPSFRSFDYKRLRGPEIKLNLVRDTSNYRDFSSRSRQINVKVSNGYLVGFDTGEFGGSLYWFDNNGIEKYKICSGRIKNIHKFNESYLVTEGLGHLNTNRGQIFEIKLKGEKWVAEKYLELGNVPFASIMIKSKSDLLVLTSKKLLKVTSNKKIIEIIPDGFWGGLYPNSGLLKDEIAYFGMRNGILKFDINTGKANWLTE